MSDARVGFDAIGVVVDWIDACKQRRLDDLLNLYDATATVSKLSWPIRDGTILAPAAGENGGRCF